MDLKFNTRAYNQITKLPNGVIKKTSTSDRLLDEINYYKNIVNSLSVLYPRLINSEIESKLYTLYLEYYPYNTLSDYFLSTNFKNWNLIFTNLYQVIELMKTVRYPGSYDSNIYARAMYIDKTINEYQNFAKTYNDTELFSKTSLIINDVSYQNFLKVWPIVEEKIKQFLLSYTPSVIHGDMCFSNILYHKQVGPRFIDMRGSFGQKGIYGDTTYDYAKLFHSVNGGYEYIINDKFTVNKISTAKYEVKLLVTDNKQLAYDSFLSVFKQINLPIIKLVEGLIYIGMCARHYDSQSRQLIMYLTGIKSLNESIQEL